jgi:uracil-DNA glycosylase family 4
MEWLGLLPPKAATTLPLLNKEIIACTKCPRLVDWREEVAVVKRKSYEAEKYWGRPVPSFGSDTPKLMIVGLAPGAHGANRTGRIFTGDSSGDWLYAALHRVGIAKIPTSTSIKDGQALRDTRITCAVHCAPPDNKPSTIERDTCAPFLTQEFELASGSTRTYVALGSFAWSSTIKSLRQLGHTIETTKFAHASQVTFKSGDVRITIFGCYHPSQQNTFTGKLTKPMLEGLLAKAAKAAGIT